VTVSWRTGRRALISAAVVLSAVAVLTSAASSSSPPGLTPYGRVIWNLDALLHDHFGQRRVYVNYAAPKPGPPAADFSTHFFSMASSRYYLFTFAQARSSAFGALKPARKPDAHIGPAGWATPMTLDRLYISCGHGRWLYEHGGEGPANWQVFCGR
jgi:hypothetical protein